MKFKDKHIEDTLDHKHKVAMNMMKVANMIMERAIVHDNSKFSEIEYDKFLEWSSDTAFVKYGTDKYKKRIKILNEALEHHYESNSHHPEHYENGIKDMTLIDLIEMVCDWKAACERYKDGDIWKSMEINKKRFNIDDQTQKYLISLLSEVFNEARGK